LRTRTAIAAVIAACAVPAFALGAGPQKFEAYLSNSLEAPKSADKASGTAKITITGNKVCWKFLSLKGATGAFAAHIHKAPPGKAGPVVVPLGAKFATSGCINAPAATVAGIEKNPGAYYVNIHTPKHQAGALRGQLHKGD
jgi:hypothetical protein